MNCDPLVVQDASLALCLFAVPLRGAQALVPGKAFRAVPAAPGRGLLGIAFLDQREGSLPAHRQAALMVATTPVPRVAWLAAARGVLALARRRLPFHLVQHPVGHDAARALGTGRLGLPSALHALDVRYEPRRVHCEVVMHGRHVITVSMPRGGAGGFEGEPLELLSYVDGAPHRTRGACDGSGVTEGGRHVEVLLGDHPIADRLRRLGLPRRPVKSVFVESLRGRLGAPERLGASPT